MERKTVHYKKDGKNVIIKTPEELDRLINSETIITISISTLPEIIGLSEEEVLELMETQEPEN